MSASSSVPRPKPIMASPALTRPMSQLARHSTGQGRAGPVKSDPTASTCSSNSRCNSRTSSSSSNQLNAAVKPHVTRTEQLASANSKRNSNSKRHASSKSSPRPVNSQHLAMKRQPMRYRLSSSSSNSALRSLKSHSEPLKPQIKNSFVLVPHSTLKISSSISSRSATVRTVWSAVPTTILLTKKLPSRRSPRLSKT